MDAVVRHVEPEGDDEPFEEAEWRFVDDLLEALHFQLVAEKSALRERQPSLPGHG